MLKAGLSASIFVMSNVFGVFCASVPCDHSNSGGIVWAEIDFLPVRSSIQTLLFGVVGRSSGIKCNKIHHGSVILPRPVTWRLWAS